VCHTMQILHVVEIRLLGRAQCPRQGTLAVAVPAADRAHTPPSEGTGGPKGRAHPHLGVPSGPSSRYITIRIEIRSQFGKKHRVAAGR
jgi:hypothetical protein